MVSRFLHLTLFCLFSSISFGQTADFFGSPTTICVGGSVQFTDLSVGASTYSWTFVDGGAGQTSTAINPIITYNNPGTYDVVLTIVNGINSDTELKEDYITVLASASANLTSALGTNNQTLCSGTALNNITYDISGATSVNFSSVPPLPSGVIALFAPTSSGGMVTYSGTPTTPGTFPYSFTTSGANCAPITVNGTITVAGSPTLSLTSGSTNQTVCVNTPISNIVYSIGGTATGAIVSGLPSGVNSSFSGGSLTISGTPTFPSGPFAYTVSTTGGPCTPVSLSGVINVDSGIQLTSGLNNQTVCNNTPITNIVYSTGISATGASVSNLPPGITGVYSGNTFTISGTPTVSGVFIYTVTTLGGTCANDSASGTITVNSAPTLTLDVVGTDNQLQCFNDPIVDITYTAGGSATGAVVVGLPLGITGSFTPNVFTITGTASAPGVYNYTVYTTGSACGVDSLSGAITVEQAPVLTLITALVSDTQEVCLNTAIDTIIYQYSGAVVGATVINLPAGVNFNIQTDSIVIFGAGLTTGLTDYTVIAYGGTCPNDSAFGQINISDEIGFNLISATGTDSQLICATPIDSIIYQISGGADTAYVINMPAGLTSGFSNDSLFISGTPASVGGFNFGVVAAGGFCPNDTLLISLSGLNPQIILASAAATDTQTWCLNSTIDSVIYTFSDATGAFVLPSTLPAGISSTVQGDSLIIFGTATSSGDYPFTVYTTGNGCVADSAYGLLSIADSAGLAIVSAVGTNAQVLCEGEPIVSIVYVLLSAADTAVVTGLPIGVSSSWSGDSLIITGSPINVGVTNYQVVSSGGVCPNDTLNGSITVLNVEIALVSPPYTNDQTVLVNTPISEVIYSVGGPVMVSDLPPGIIVTYTPGIPNLLTLSGTPIDTGAFYYVVEFAGDCDVNSLVGKILVVSTFTTIDSTLSDTSNVYIPNLFSPNGDGFNETWQIPALASFPNNEVTVINREGQIVFNQFEYNGTWDGNYNGKPLPEATYYYLINIEQGTKILRGPITILRNQK
ncbi:MAG: gliding motility-associated C-terminal domain-containing protein [Crocinitomicaceae bacterium]|nr:gliding motility-associated C-terminal domain-containing protein [Crocinitomicaceae bacterium]